MKLLQNLMTIKPRDIRKEQKRASLPSSSQTNLIKAIFQIFTPNRESLLSSQNFKVKED